MISTRSIAVSNTSPQKNSHEELAHIIQSPSCPKREVSQAAREAAMELEREFHDCSPIRNDAMAGMVAHFEPEEVELGSQDPSRRLNGHFKFHRVRKIILKDSHRYHSPFDDVMGENRKRCADRAEEGLFAVKLVDRSALQKGPAIARKAACSLIRETKTLMHLDKHPHIIRIYGIHYKGASAGFGGSTLERNFFTIVDDISETLKQRLSSWRKKEAHEKERRDDLQKIQSELSQRLMIVVDIVAALEFLAARKLIYSLNPRRVGFDSRMGRIKLCDFGHCQHAGEKTSVALHDENDMSIRVYAAPEVLRGQRATLCADVFSMGMLLWEIIVLKPAFSGMSREKHYKEVVEKHARPTLSANFAPGLRNLVERCCASTSRPGMKNVRLKLEQLLLEGTELVTAMKQKNGSKSEQSRQLAAKKEVRTTIGTGKPSRSEKCRSTGHRTIKYKRENDSPERDGKSVRSKETKASQSTCRSGTSQSRRSLGSIKPLSMRLRRSKSSSSTADRSPGSQRFLQEQRRSSKNRKIKYEQRSNNANEKDQDVKSIRSKASAKSKGSQKSTATPSSRQATSLRFVVKSSPLQNSIKEQVLCIKKNLVGEDDESAEEIIVVNANPQRGRGIRRHVSSQRLSCRRLNGRSSSREGSFSSLIQSGGVLQQKLDRGQLDEKRKSTETSTLRLAQRRIRRSRSSGNLEPETDASSRRTVRKSLSGTDTMILGDPSRQSFKSPVSFRRKSSNKVAGLAAIQHHLLLGESSASIQRENEPERRGKLKSSSSGGLLQASSRDIGGGNRAKAKIQKDRERQSRRSATSATMAGSSRELLKPRPRRQMSNPLLGEARRPKSLLHIH